MSSVAPQRRFSFGLRALMLIVVACAVCFAYVAHRSAKYKRQQAELSGLANSLHVTLYERESDSFSFEYLFGREFFDEVRAIAVHASFTEFATIAEFTSVRIIHFRGAPIHDLTPLSELRELQHLRLRGTAVADLSPLAGCLSLRRLDISSLHGTHLPVISLSPLSGLTQLESISLECSAGTDLSPLGNLKRLRAVGLRADGPVDLSRLAGLPSLKMMRVNNSACSDDDVAEFRRRRLQFGFVDPVSISIVPDKRIYYDH